MDFGIDFYTDVLDLKYLLEVLDDGPFTKNYKNLNAAIVELIEDYSLVGFIPVDVHSERSLLTLKNAIDKVRLVSHTLYFTKKFISGRVLYKHDYMELTKN